MLGRIPRWAFVLVALLGCSHVRTAEKVLTAAQNAEAKIVPIFEKWSAQRQEDIARRAVVEGKASQGRAELDAYLKAEAKASQILLDLDALIAMGDSMIPLCEAGLRKESDLDTWIVSVSDLIEQLRLSLKAMGMNVP